ncbi:Uncharacterized protein APZ42_022316 [Daphnia magna]|uniref:Uncharacterized protein n=1 Tax=Daphnia magna TaxID=35525 RepID=A0A162C6S9_9CRUS|nr:Uncharacterized protein APZ42_022316 [Daphnia magna]
MVFRHKDGQVYIPVFGDAHIPALQDARRSYSGLKGRSYSACGSYGVSSFSG